MHHSFAWQHPNGKDQIKGKRSTWNGIKACNNVSKCKLVQVINVWGDMNQRNNSQAEDGENLSCRSSLLSRTNNQRLSLMTAIKKTTREKMMHKKQYPGKNEHANCPDQKTIKVWSCTGIVLCLKKNKICQDCHPGKELKIQVAPTTCASLNWFSLLELSFLVCNVISRPLE